MSLPSVPDDADTKCDPITWKQIFIGYGMVLIMLMIAVLHQLGLSENPDTLSTIGSVAVVAVVFTATVLAGPVSAFQRAVLAARPVLEDKLQWAAIVFLVLLSCATVVHGILVLPASGWVSP